MSDDAVALYRAEEFHVESMQESYELATKLDVQRCLKNAEEQMNSLVCEQKRLQGLYDKAKDFEYGIDECPECWSSDIPGRHYKHNDTNNQYVNCSTCNQDGQHI